VRLITRNVVCAIGPQPAEDNWKHEHDQPDAVSGQTDPIQRAVLFQKAEKTFFNQAIAGFTHDSNRHDREHLRFPTASNLEMIVLKSVASDVRVMRGMSSGLSHPTIRMVRPKRKRQPAFA